MSGGSFHDGHDREVTWEIIEAHDYNGEVWSGGEAEDRLQSADNVFYSVEVGDETYYRWVAGPFEDMGALESAIIDEGDFYE